MIMGKKDENEAPEGLRADDGSQPVTKGVKILEYNIPVPGTIHFMGMSLSCMDLEIDRKTNPKQEQSVRDKKNEKDTAHENTKEGTAASTTAGKNGGRKK